MSGVSRDKLMAAAVRRLELLKRQDAFDPANLESRPTEKQQLVFDDFGKVKQQWIRAGNQCKPAYSLVLMADGTQKEISKVEAGDLVMAFDFSLGKAVPAPVIRRWDNGVREVWRYHFASNQHTDSTPNHEMVYHSGTRFGKRRIDKARELIIVPCETRGTREHDWSTSKIRYSEYLGEMPVYDLHIDHPDHTYICDGLATGNSGKSQTCARIVAHVITERHPIVKQRREETGPSSWGTESLLVIIAARTGKQIEDSLLPKLRSYLEPGTYKEVRIGNIIQRLELDNGNRIVFQSLENPSVARQRLMSYVAHLTWTDELPPTMDLVRELLVRTQARNGYSLWSFTPTVVSLEIQKYADSLKEPEGKVYRFHMLDNPLYSDPKRKEELLARYSHLPAHIQDAIFKGEWITSDEQVYYFNYETMVEMPDGYSPLWRHVESVDPALKSALGLTIWAENPTTGIWYCIHCEYIRGIYVPTELVEAIKARTSRYNIVRRISDPHESWYIGTASSLGTQYIGVYKKNERKSDLIKNLQQNLGPRLRIAPHCQELITELQECRWSDRAEGKIVNASSYHLLDSAQYFCDNIPKSENKIQSTSWEDWLFQANEKRKAAEEKQRNGGKTSREEIRKKALIKRGSSTWNRRHY